MLPDVILRAADIDRSVTDFAQFYIRIADNKFSLWIAVTLRAFASEHALDLAAVLQKFEARSEAIANAGIATKDIIYDASFGRPLDYYTGLVYEIRAPGVEKEGVLAGGGRYDRLLTMLGASENIPGVGFSIWLDRLQMLVGEKK